MEAIIELQNRKICYLTNNINLNNKDNMEIDELNKTNDIDEIKEKFEELLYQITQV